MPYKIDYRHIDNNRWPGAGPVYIFLEFNRVVADGICIDILPTGSSSGIARQRGYEILDENGNLCELILSHTEFVGGIFKSYRISRMFRLINIAYGLMLGLKPEQISYPGGLYGERCERRAMLDYMRPKTDAEIAASSEIVRRLSACAKGRSKLHGMYCLDEAKLNRVRADLDRALNDETIHNYFGIKCILKNTITDKIRALLENHPGVPVENPKEVLDQEWNLEFAEPLSWRKPYTALR